MAVLVSVVVFLGIYFFFKYSNCLMTEIKKSGHENVKKVMDDMGH